MIHFKVSTGKGLCGAFDKDPDKLIELINLGIAREGFEEAKDKIKTVDKAEKKSEPVKDLGL